MVEKELRDKLNKESVLRELEEVLGGSSRKIREVRELIYKASQNDCNVLIAGETGTGKEIVANQIHRLWAERKGLDREMVVVSCPDIYEEQWEAELFGIGDKVATNVGSRSGKLKEADGTTLFLDEIGDIPSRLQSKLLRATQFKKFQAVGGQETSSCFRLVCATNKTLSPVNKEREAGFREDLFYRLNEMPIHIQPLRHRREDIVPIFLQLVARYLPDLPKSRYKLEPCHVFYLLFHDWRGNVREMESYLKSCTLPTSNVAPLGFLFDDHWESMEGPIGGISQGLGLPCPLSEWGYAGEVDLIELMSVWRPKRGQERLILNEEDAFLWVAEKFVPSEEILRDQAEQKRARYEAYLERRQRISQQPSTSRITPPPKPKTILEKLASKPASLKELEALYLSEVLKNQPIESRKKGKSTEALAKKLGIAPDTLKKKIRRLQEQRPKKS